MVASMAKGVMRFVGGQVSHTNGAELITPVATIGVRGGMMTIIFLHGGGVLVVDHFGHIEVANNVSRKALLRSGYGVQVNGLGAPIGPPFRAGPGILEEAFSRSTSGQGQHGGAVNLPTDALAAR